MVLVLVVNSKELKDFLNIDKCKCLKKPTFNTKISVAPPNHKQHILKTTQREQKSADSEEKLQF